MKEAPVDRDAIWISVIRFYKRAMGDKSCLTKELMVRFEDEPGIDARALKREFFDLALKEIKLRLLEGPEDSLLPIKDSSKGLFFWIAGAVVVHSVIQGCATGIQFLAPCVYSYLLFLEEDVIIASVEAYRSFVNL